MARKWIFLILGVLVVLLLAAYFGAGYMVYGQLGRAEGSCDKHLANRPDRFANLSNWPEFDMSPFFMPEYEDVRFPSRTTGFEIAAWYVEGDADKPAVILLDGLGGCRHAQAALVPAGMLWRNGYNVLIIDLHETGESAIDDGYSTLGNDEFYDVLGAWDWLQTEKGFASEEIGVAANSLAAATSLYAFAEEPRMAAVFLNSPFANIPQVVRSELRRAGFPAFLATPTLLVGRLITGENLAARSPLEAITHGGQRPVFVVHSVDDKTIDVDHSRQLEAIAAENDVNADFWYIDKADHVAGPAVHTDEYEEKLVGFFASVLKDP